MRAYKCDLCGAYHDKAMDAIEFKIVVDGTDYQDICEPCLSKLQRAIWHIKNTPRVAEE